MKHGRLILHRQWVLIFTKPFYRSSSENRQFMKGFFIPELRLFKGGMKLVSIQEA